MFYRVRARVRRGEATVRVLVLPADVTALVALGALYLDTGQFLLYVFVLHDQLKVDLEREFSRVSKCLCNMHVHDFNYSSQIWESVINFNILELIEFNKKYSFYKIQLIQKKPWNGERVTFGDDENWFLNTEKKSWTKYNVDHAWSDVCINTWTPVRWLSKSPCMLSFSLSDFTGVAYRNRFRYVMTLRWSTEGSDSSDALRIGSTPILFPASIATSVSQDKVASIVYIQNKNIKSNYYINTE